MEGEAVVALSRVSKTYPIYSRKSDRLKEAFHPLGKKYHSAFHALNGVDLEVFRGETYGIIGANGSGKSTLLQIISGVLQPSSGDVQVRGRVTALLELGAGFNPEFSGRDNVYLCGALLGLTRSDIDSRLPRILDFAEIGEFIDQPVKTYSSGMYVRLAFSIYANLDPEIFIVDEALAVGDSYFVHRCMHRFQEMQSQGVTIFLVSHDASAIKRLCNRAAWIERGEIRAEGDPSSVVDKYLAHLFKHELVQASSLPQPLIEGDFVVKDRILGVETKIPNCDERLGNQTLTILGVSLYNSAREPILSCDTKSTVILRMSIQNVALMEPHRVLVGYIFRDFRGVELASTNSRMENVEIPWIPLGSTLNVEMEVKIPFLYPGSYTFSPSLSIEAEGRDVLCDRIMNAVALQITCSTEIHVLMKFDTDIRIDV